MTFIHQSLHLLRQQGYKITGPRMAVLELLKAASTPLSAYEIEERISTNIPINVVTIYRILELFEGLGIVHRIHTKEGYVRCDFEKKPGCHSFAICKVCGRTDEFVQLDCVADRNVPNDLPYKTLSHLSEMVGTCLNCA